MKTFSSADEHMNVNYLKLDKRTSDATMHAQRTQPRRPRLIEDAICRHLPSSLISWLFLLYFLT